MAVSKDRVPQVSSAPLIPSDQFHKPGVEEVVAHSVINFKNGYTATSTVGAINTTSLLSFEQTHNERASSWDDHDYQWNHHHQMNLRISEELNCFQTASDFGSVDNNSAAGNKLDHQNQHGVWLYSESTVSADSFEDSATHEAAAGFHKPHQMVPLFVMHVYLFIEPILCLGFSGTMLNFGWLLFNMVPELQVLNSTPDIANFQKLIHLSLFLCGFSL